MESPASDAGTRENRMHTMAAWSLRQARLRWESRSARAVLQWGGLFSAFLALNLADLHLTRRLFQHLGAAAQELNPLANGLLYHYGWTGLIGFKLGITMSVALLLAVVAMHRPQLGWMTLTLSCLLLSAVVFYNAILNYFPSMSSHVSVAEIRAIQERHDALNRRAAQLRSRLSRRAYSLPTTHAQGFIGVQVR
jgi:hypothetical protein